MIAHINEYKQEQTVLQHCEGTACVAEKSSKIVGLENVMKIAGLLHDIGKNKKIFDSYIRDNIAGKSSHKRGKIDHSTAGGQFLYDNMENKNVIMCETLQLIATAIFSHHGLMDMLDGEKGTDLFGRRLKKTDIDYDETISNSSDLLKKYNLKEVFLKASEEIGEIDKKLVSITKRIDGVVTTKAFLQGCLQRLITSMLIDADRIDTAKFMTGIDYGELSGDELSKLWNVYQNRLNEKLATFTKTDKISLLRKQMSQECFDFAKNKCGIYTLPIPTGGGKTLASLRFALEHCKKYGKSKIIYTAPYLSILEQNAAEIRSILKDDDNILEHHSNIVENDDFAENKYSALTESWQSPIILTTMVRFLETLFSSKTRDVRRFNKLKNSVIIIDEVQNIPTNILNPFNATVNFLSEICGATIVLCSATQPNLNIPVKKILYSENKEMIKNVDDVMLEFKRTNIVDCTRLPGYTTEELADFVLEKFDENELVILNTKSAVKSLYDEIKARNTDIRLYQLTTYMCAKHRADMVEEIKEKLGKEKLICISTQLIEAGVDISFNNVIRSIAGLDSVIQAAGRCNRHGNTGCRDVYVVNFNEEKLIYLPEINKAKNSMEKVIKTYRDNTDSLGVDYLSSREAIDEYYNRYFENIKDEMNYSIKKLNDNMYRLLSSNKKCRDAYVDYEGEPYPYLMAQAYKTAGECFKVIGSDTIGLIVHYKDNDDDIKTIETSRDYGEIRKALRTLQRYTVNVYRTDKTFSELLKRRAVTTYMDGAVYVLDRDFYDENVGVKSELNNIIF